MQDYVCPAGYRLATHPERITAIVVQPNGNAYDEGIDNDFWKPTGGVLEGAEQHEKRDARAFVTYEATKWQYTHGVKTPNSSARMGRLTTSSR